MNCNWQQNRSHRSGKGKKSSHSSRIPGNKLNGFMSEVSDYFYNEVFMKLSFMGQLAATFENLNKIIQFSEDSNSHSISERKNWLIGAKTFSWKEY